MNRKAFFLVQLVFITGAFAYLCWAPRNYVATAIVQTSYHIASPAAADELKSPADVQFGGTIARGFMDRRVLEEVVRKHSAAAVTAEWIQENCAVTPSRLNRTITLRLKSRRPAVACEIVLALIEERLRMDVITQSEADQPLIEGLIGGMKDLQSQLFRAREALRQRVAQIGDPLESGVQWQQSTDSATMLDHTNIDLQKRISQARHRSAVLEAGIAGSARGLRSSEFAGYEFFGPSPKVPANFDSTSDFPWLRSSGNSAVINKGSTGLRSHSYQLGTDHGIHREPEPTRINLQGQIDQSKNKLASLVEDEVGASRRSSDQDLTAIFDSHKRRSGDASGAVDGAALEGATIADASVSVVQDSTALAQTESKLGTRHASVLRAIARLRQSRASLLAELVMQEAGINAATDATKAAMLALAESARDTDTQFQRLATARTDPEYLKSLITVAGLETAYGEATARLQVLLARAKNSPPRFSLIQSPVPTALPMTPDALSVFVASEIAALVLFWLVSPWTSRGTP